MADSKRASCSEFHAEKRRRGVTGRACRMLAPIVLLAGGCQVVPGVKNSELPIGTPFEGQTDEACYPVSAEQQASAWRTGQVEFVPIRRDSNGRFFIPDEQKNRLIRVCYQSTAHLVVYLVPEQGARRDAWIDSIAIVRADGEQPPAGEFTVDGPGLERKGVVDLAQAPASVQATCPVGATIETQRRHVVVFDRNTTKAEYSYRICIRTVDGELHLVDPRIKNGGRRH
jgi:hypothetical protein